MVAVQSCFLPVPAPIAEAEWRSFRVQVLQADRSEMERAPDGLISILPAEGGCFLTAATRRPSIVDVVSRALGQPRARGLSEHEFEGFRLAVASRNAGF